MKKRICINFINAYDIENKKKYSERSIPLFDC